MVDSKKYLVKGLEELDNLAKELLLFSGENKILAFYGEMGAGKTTFIRSLCKSLGVKQNVSSPTFSLINEYLDANGHKIYHFDFYRIKNEREAVDLGCEEYFISGDLCLIEWPEKILNLLPQHYIKIEIVLESQQRVFTFSYD